MTIAEGKSFSKQYIVRFNNNSNRCWDGKEVWLDAEIQDELYDGSELIDGANIIAPWKEKGERSVTGMQCLWTRIQGKVLIMTYINTIILNA